MIDSNNLFLYLMLATMIAVGIFTIYKLRQDERELKRLEEQGEASK